MEFKIGDKVIVKKLKFSSPHPALSNIERWGGKIGKIISYSPISYAPLVKFKEKTGSYTGDPTGMSKYIPKQFLEIYDEKKYKEKEELRKKMKDIDPYEEENWLEEKRILKYNQFITESLGVSSYLMDISNEIHERLKKEKSFVLKTNLRNKNITINVNIKKIKNNDAEIIYEDSEKLIFTMNLKENKLSYILHEIKHIDKALSRNMKVEPGHYLKYVGKDVSNEYKFLFKNKTSREILIHTLELINQSEFESYYNEFYIELKDLIKDDMTYDEKKKLIENYLNDQNIYVLYKFYYKHGNFDISEFFENSNNLNQFIRILINKIEQFYNEEPNYYDWEKLKEMMQYYLKNNNERDYIRICKKINSLINVNINKGYKKFHRLYSIFLN